VFVIHCSLWVTLRSFWPFRYAPRHNKSSRGTVRPETDFVRSALSSLSMTMTTTTTTTMTTTTLSRLRRYIWCSYRARNNFSLLDSAWNDRETNFLATRQRSPRKARFTPLYSSSISSDVIHIAWQMRELFKSIAFYLMLESCWIKKSFNLY